MLLKTSHENAYKYTIQYNTNILLKSHLIKSKKMNTFKTLYVRGSSLEL